jgi:hypothetical protein
MDGEAEIGNSEVAQTDSWEGLVKVSDGHASGMRMPDQAEVSVEMLGWIQVE